jgi:2-polyprenyl-6-methoxyphenol hydroxylase-like FAD-dependent oxidoreductase
MKLIIQSGKSDSLANFPTIIRFNMSFRAIIVGGSVAGLTLANLLERLGIDFLMLEAHQTIAPQLGASIGLLPNGLRILDQLGCYEAIRDKVGDCYNHTNMRTSDGRPVMGRKSVSLSEQLEEK